MHAYLCLLVCLTSPAFLVRLWWVSRELVALNMLQKCLDEEIPAC